jgi:hypothetical protein
MVDHIHLDKTFISFPFNDYYQGLFVFLFIVIVHTSK